MRRTLVLLALTLSAATLFGCAPPKPMESDTVTVKGIGTTLAKPDLARIGFTASHTDVDPRKAMAAAGKTGQAIAEALSKAGIKEEDLRTTGVTLEPQYDWNRSGQPLKDYRADINIEAVVHDVDTIGELVSTATKAGAKRVNGPMYELDDENPGRVAAIDKAVADAQVRAEAMSAAGGRLLGAVLSMSDADVYAPSPVARFVPNYSGSYMMHGTSASMFDGRALPVGQLEMQAEVVVEYRLE